MSYDVDDSVLSWLFQPIITFSLDLLIGVGYSLLAVIVVVTASGPVRALIVLPLVFFLPGYGIVAALFPASPDQRPGVSPALPTRAALSFGVSVAILPIMGLGIAFADMPYSGPTIVGALALITVSGLLIAGRRRVHLPRDDRFGIQVRRVGGTFTPGVDVHDSPVDALLNIVVVLAIILALGTLGYAMFVPGNSGTYSQFSLLSETPPGELVAAEYPTEFVAGADEEMILAVENHEREPLTYSIIAELQRVDHATGTVVERSILDRQSTFLAPDETWDASIAVSPEMTGERLRLVFYLYTGEAPAEPTAASAKEHLFLWVNVSERGSTPGGTETPTPRPTSTPTPTSTPPSPSPTPSATSGSPTATPTTSQPTYTPAPPSNIQQPVVLGQ